MNKQDQILCNTEDIIQWIKTFQEQKEWTVWIPVIAAAITAILALFGIFYSTRYVKNNIRMNARIEWIQRTRETAAGAISLCYALIYESDNEKARSILLKAQERINLLILYFGPDKIEEILEEKDVVLKKEESNEGKNNYIVKLLEEILTDLDKYYRRKYCAKVQILEMEIKSLNKSYPLEETGERLLDKDGNWIYVKNYPKEYYIEKEKLEKEIRELKNSDEIAKDIKDLREILRSYLKIEWTVVKKGK